MEKIYRKVSVKERLPNETDVYYTNVGKVPFFKGERKLTIDTDQEILWWLEEVKLPTDEEIFNGSLQYLKEVGSVDNKNVIVHDWTNGAKWLRDLIKNK